MLEGAGDQILFVMTAELPGQDVLVPEMKCDSIKMCDLLKQATLFWSVWYWIYLLGTNWWEQYFALQRQFVLGTVKRQLQLLMGWCSPYVCLKGLTIVMCSLQPLPGWPAPTGHPSKTSFELLELNIHFPIETMAIRLLGRWTKIDWTQM